MNINIQKIRKSEIRLLGGISNRAVADGKRGKGGRLELRQCIVRRPPPCKRAGGLHHPRFLLWTEIVDYNRKRWHNLLLYYVLCIFEVDHLLFET